MQHFAKTKKICVKKFFFKDKEKIKNDLNQEKNSLLQELKEKKKFIDEKEKEVAHLSEQLGELHDQNELFSKQCSDLKSKLNLLGSSLTTSSLKNKELLMQCKNGENNLKEMQAESLKVVCLVMHQLEFSSVETFISVENLNYQGIATPTNKLSEDS